MDWLVLIHSFWRYVVVIAAIVAIVVSIRVYARSMEWNTLADRAGLIYTITLDVQLLVGILVWLLADYSRSDVFLTWIHPLFMIGAVAVAHIGRVRAERAQGSRAKGEQALLFFGASFLIILLAIPIYSWLSPGA